MSRSQVSLVREIYNEYKRNARVKSIDFNIPFIYFVKYIHRKCYYCGSPPIEREKRGEKLFLNGLDRIDSSKGYTKENVRTCCIVCNRMKTDFKTVNFLTKVREIYENFFGT